MSAGDVPGGPPVQPDALTVGREWAVATASVRGARHVRQGQANQDAVRTGVLPDGGVFATVADGHGGDRYVRSGTGARLAVDAAAAVADRLTGTGPGTALEVGAAGAARSFATELVATWRAAVAADLAARPLGAPERSRLAAAPGEGDAIAYGATSLTVLAHAGQLVAFQIGDGDVLAVGADGTVARPMPADGALVGGRTTSLCQDDAVERMRAAVLPPDTALVLLATDGYGTAFADPTWPSAVGRDLLGQVREHGLRAVAAHLPRWAQESAAAGGDDVTLAVLAATETALAAPVPPAHRAPAAARSRRPVLVAAGVVAALVLFLGGLLVGRATASDDAGSGASVPATATVTAAAAPAPTTITAAPTTTAVATTAAAAPSATSPTTAPRPSVTTLRLPTTTLGPTPPSTATTAPAASTTTGPPPPDAVLTSAKVVADGLVVTFDPARPGAARAVVTSTADGTRAGVAGGWLWEIGDSGVSVRIPPDDTREDVPVPVRPLGLAAAGARVWVVGTDAVGAWHLVAVDTASRAVQGDWPLAPQTGVPEGG